MMKFQLTVPVLALLFLGSHAHADQSNTASDLSNLANRTLNVDGITGARIVDVSDSKSPLFVFTYCRKGAPALRRHEVMSLESPDAPRAIHKVVKDQEVEADSKSCMVTG